MIKSISKAFALVSILAVAIALAPLPADAGSKKDKPLSAPSVFNAEKRKSTRNKWGQRLSYSGYAQFKAQGETNLGRDDAIQDRRDEMALYLGLVGRVDLGRRAIGFAHGQLKWTRKQSHTTDYDPTLQWITKEAFVSFQLSAKQRLTVGRMRFSDLTRWVVDASVDGVHFAHRSPDQVTEVAAFAATGDDEGRFVMVHHGRVLNKLRYGAIALLEDLPNDRRLRVSGYALGQMSKQTSFEANVAATMSDAAGTGLAFDVRTTHKFGASRLKPQVLLGFAAGTADFRQSGVHSNKTYNGGQTQVHRYGYVFQPDLTNLAVGTVAVGLRPSRNFSVDLGLHVYGQVQKSRSAPVARFSGAMTGDSRFVGTEVSLVGAWRPNKRSKVDFRVGRFKPGRAFADRSDVTRVSIRLTTTF